MFKFYVVPDATKLSSHSAIYSAENMKLFWDPRSESDAYAIVEAKGKSEINKASSLEFSILPTNICYNDFYKKKSVVLAYDDDQLIFEGEVSTNPRDFYKQRRITCTDPLTYLSGSIQPPDEKNEVVVPESSSGTLYIKVPLIWYEDGSPKKLQWYERTKNSSGELEYSVSKDTTANPDKVYYYTVTSSGENVSGTTITKSAATKESIQAHISRILNVHNTQVDSFRRIFPGTIDNSDSAEHEFSSTGWRTSWDAFNSDILESYGRCAKITTGNNGTLLLNYVDIKQMSSISPVIEYTRNMIEMTESTDNNGDIFTVLVPIGKDNLTVSGVSGHDSGGDGEVDPYVVSWGGAKRYVVVSKKAVARYGYIVKTQSFNDIESASELYDKAVKFIKNNYDYHTEYDVKAIDLKVLGEADHRISVGDKCRLKSTWHGVDERDLYVISAQYDYINPENDSFKLGIPTSDKEAGNRRLSSQTSNNKKRSSKNAANAASSAGRLSSILENYIHVTEWGLEMNSRLKNEVESADKKYTTRFIQDEEHLNLAAEKLFGIDADGRGDKDAGYVRVLTSEYRDGDGPYKNPVTEHWFEKKNGEYVLSTDTTCDPSVVGNKTYYIQRLWSRYSDIDVGAGGIKARVDGNYETSTYCSSWIQSNENEILALTGHLYVDEDGHVHVTSGSGMRTDHDEEKTTPTYIHVPSTMYAGNPNPLAKHWYERVLDSSGAWIGQGKADFNTNDKYYKATTDTTVDRSKYYYYKSNIRESFVAEFGLYDEDNLTAGVMARTINNPTYHKVSDTIVQQLAQNSGSPAAQGWYEYNKATGTYGLTGDTAVQRDSTHGNPINKYYTVTNNMESWTYLNGEHIVVGKVSSEYVQVPKSEYDGADPKALGWFEYRSNGTYFASKDTSANPYKMYYRKQEVYNGMNDETKGRIAKYIEGHNLDGTITEIASDVLYVHALFAEYLDVYAHKVFGSNDQDSGFVEISNTSGQNPMAKGWFEYVNGKYILTSDSEPKPGKKYYIRRITDRIANFNVDENGIHGIVQGNYERSINSASWIEANEDQILAVTGHVYVDENGQVIIKSGSGFRTGHTDPKTVHKYIQIPKSEYTGNPKSKGWYERKLNQNGKWVGDGQPNQQTTDGYYQATNDTSANLSKYYYKLATTEEEFFSDYGVYDENSLKAGIVARMINNPEYTPMPANWYKSAHNPKAEGLYVLTNKGSMAATNDTSIVSGTTYYSKSNQSVGWTDVKGEHVVIGTTDGYSGIEDAATIARIKKYITGHNLDGTITEIASDVVVVNALIAKYIETDTITIDSNLASDYIWSNHISSAGEINASTYMCAPDFWLLTNPDREPGAGDSIKTGLLSVVTSDGADNNQTVVPTYSGDNVTLSFYTRDQQLHTVTFTKPASLGTVTWSSGERLTVKTAGGKTFFTADLLIPKVYADASVSYGKDVNGSIAPNSLLRNKHILYATMDVTGTWTGLQLGEEEDDPVVWSGTVYFDGTKAYNAGQTYGISEAKGKFGLVGPSAATVSDQSEAMALNNATTLSYGSSYMVYKTYDGSMLGSKTYFKTPSDRYDTGYDTAVDTLAIDPSSNQALGYSDSVTVTAKVRKRDGTYSEKSITVTSPGDNSSPSYDCDDIRVGATDIKSSKPRDAEELSWGSSISSADGRWFIFEAWLKGTNGTKKYAINLS